MAAYEAQGLLGRLTVLIEPIEFYKSAPLKQNNAEVKRAQGEFQKLQRLLDAEKAAIQASYH